MINDSKLLSWIFLSWLVLLSWMWVELRDHRGNRIFNNIFNTEIRCLCFMYSFNLYEWIYNNYNHRGFFFLLLFRIGIENEEWVISLLSHLCWELHMCSADLTRLVVTRRPLTTTSVFSLFFKLSACLNKVGWKSMSKPASWKLLCLKWRRNQRVQPGVVFFITADWSCCR